MKRQMTREQRHRRRAEYSIRAAAICFALMVAICAASGAFSLQVEELPPSEEPASLPVPQEVAAEAESEPAPENPLAKYHKIEGATLTHYCICERCCGKSPEHPAYGITASGREAEPYSSIAVDPFLIPLGAYILIDYGDGNVLAGRADDTGIGVAGSHIDLCVSSHQEALEEGVKTVDVYWIEEVDVGG